MTNIVCTRPEHQIDALRRQLPFPVDNVALLTIEEYADLPEQRQHILDIDQFDHIVVVSPNAASALLKLLDNYWPMLPEHPNWYAPGAGTAKALAAGDIDASYPKSHSNSEALVQIMPIEKHEKVLIVKGEGGRDYIQNHCQQQGAFVSELNLYRAQVEISHQAMAKLLQADLIVTSSQRIIDAMSAYPELKKVPLFTTSERLHLVAQSHNWLNSQYTNQADNRHLAQALTAWHKDHTDD